MTASVNGKVGAAAPARRPVKRDPDGTRRRILEAATDDFSTRGLGGARINEIADRAGVNKRMLYHYFGDKDGLFLAVLEESYARLRSRERDLELDHLPAETAMRRLVETTWEYYLKHPEFIRLLNSENMHRARHLRRSSRAREMHSPFVEMIDQILKRGAQEDVFRDGIDPVELYIAIAGLGYFYLSNRFTLSVIFDRDLEQPDLLARWRALTVDMVLAYLRPRAGG